MRKKALLVTSVFIVILALVLVTVIGCTPTENAYAVTLNMGDEVQVVYGTELQNPPDYVEKEGFEFDAWYTDAEYTTKAVFPLPLTADIVLYARYLKKFTLTLVIGFDEKNQTMEVAKLTEDPTVSGKDGYTFAGWYYDNAFTQKVEISADNPVILEEDTTFYAKWDAGEKETFTVTFVTNGGTEIHDMQCAVIEKSPVTTREGYKFAGWYTRQSLTGSQVRFPYTVTKNTTLYADWAQDQGSSEYEYIDTYKEAKMSLETIFDKFPAPENNAILDLQTVMTTANGTARIEMKGNFNVGGQNEFMFRITMLDVNKTSFAVYFIGNEMYMDLGDDNPMLHFSDIKPDYVIAFLGDTLTGLDIGELLDSLKVGGIDIASLLISMLFDLPHYTATVRLSDNRVLDENYNFIVNLNSLVTSINSLIGMIKLGDLIGIDLNLSTLFNWLNSNIPLLNVNFIVGLKYDESVDDTVVTSMRLVAEDNDPDNDIDGEVFSWEVEKAELKPGSDADLIDFPEITETREFSLTNIQFDLDLQLYSDENGLDVAKLINLFAPDLGLPEDTLVLNSEFGYRVKANIDLDLNYLNTEEDKNLIALEIYAIDKNGDIILNDKVPMLLGIYYRNGSLYVSLNSMMPNYWKANNIKVDGINLKGVVSYLIEMITTAIDEYFGTNWDDYKTSGAQGLMLSQSGRDVITLAEDEETGEDTVYISPTIQSLIFAVASVVGFQDALYATDDQIVIEVNQKLWGAINQFMGDTPIELPIALDGKVALNMYDEGLESVEVTATVGVPDKDNDGNVVKDENGNIVTSDPIDVKLKAHNFMIGFRQNEFMDGTSTSLEEYIDGKLSVTSYSSNLGEILESVLSGVDLNARALVTFNQGTYAIGDFLAGLGLTQLEGIPLEWDFEKDFVMDVGLSIMMSIDRQTRQNSMFAIEITALQDIIIGGISGMDAGKTMLGIYGFYSQDTSSGGTGSWVPHILLDLTNIKIMNITLPKLSIEFDFVQTLLDLFDNIKIGDQLLNDFDLAFDIMSLFGSDDESSGDASTSALFAESDGTAAGTTLSDFGSIVLGLNAEKIYASLTLAAVGKLLNMAGVDLGGFDLSTIDLALDMDITRTEGWTIEASGNFMMPKQEDLGQEQNFRMVIEIGTQGFPLTVGYVRDKLTEIKNRVQAEVNSYTDDLIQAIINTVGFLSIDVTMDLVTHDSHIDFSKVINNILVSQGQYLDLPIDLYLDDWSSVTTLTLQWDLDLETITNSKLLLAFKYGEKDIISLGVSGGNIIVDLRGLGLVAFKMTNSNLVTLLIGFLQDMISDIGDLNLTDIINGLLMPEEEVQLNDVSGEIAQGLNFAEPEAEGEDDETMDLIMSLLQGVHAENVNLYVDLAAEAIDNIFKSLLGISLGFDIDLSLGLDMVDGELVLDLGLSDVVDFHSDFKLKVGKEDGDKIDIDTSVADLDASTGETMARTLLDRLEVALSIDVLSNNIDTGGTDKYLRLTVEKLTSNRVLTDAKDTPTIPQGAFLVTIARVNSGNDFNDTTSTSSTKALAYVALNYNTGKMTIYLAKGNISLIVDFGDYVAVDVDLDLVAKLAPVFQNLIDQIDAMSIGTNEAATLSEGDAQAVPLAEGDDATTEEPSPFAELFADLDVLKLLNGGIDIRLTSAGVFNIDVSFNAYEINKLIDGVMSLIFGPNTILNLAELAPDMFGSNYLENVNWDRVNNDSRGFWETLKAQLTPMLKEVVANMVSSALSPLITDTLLNSTYEEIHDILMRLLPLPVFNRLNVGINTLDGTFSNIYIKGYDDNQAVYDDDGVTILSNTTYNGGTRTTQYTAGSRSSSYKTELYLFNKSPSVGVEDNTVSGNQEEGIVDWGDITKSVNFEPYEYSSDPAQAYAQLYNKYFANKSARYQYKSTVRKSDVTFYIAVHNEDTDTWEAGAKLTSATMDLLNVVQIANENKNISTKATVKNVIAKTDFGKELMIAVNILPATDLNAAMPIQPIEAHAYDEEVDEITINLVTGVSRNIRTEDMTMFTYSADTYTAHDKTVSVTFKNSVSANLTVHFLDSTVVDIVGSSNPMTFEIDLYEFTSENRNIDQFTPEYLYIRYEDGATSRVKVDQWINTENANAVIGNKAQNDMSLVNVPVQAVIGKNTSVEQTMTLTVDVKTKEISALGMGSTLDALEINPYTYFLNKIGYIEETIKPETIVAYYYEVAADGTVQSYNEQVSVNIAIDTNSAGQSFDETLLNYQSEGAYGGTVSLDTTKYGERTGVDPTTEGYADLAPGYFGWSKTIAVNVVKNTIIAVYFDKELTQEIFTVHPYEFNALDDSGKAAYFPSKAYVKFSSNAVMEIPIRWYDASGNLFDPVTYVPDYDSYSEQWQIEIGFMTDEYSSAATANGVDPVALENNFKQKAYVGVYVDGMGIDHLNIPGAGSGDDYYEVNPIDVLYLGKNAFPSEVEVVYTDGSKASIGVYQWVGAEDIEVSMNGGEVREITVMLTKDGVNNYTVRYKVVAKDEPIYAYEELVLDPFGYITVVNEGQSINTYREFGTTLEVKFEKPSNSVESEIMPLAENIYTVNVQSWNFNRIKFSSGEVGVAVATVAKSDDTTIDVEVPVRMKTIAKKDNGLLDLRYQYYGYDFIVVMYDKDNDVYFTNFSEEISIQREGEIQLSISYWCEDDVELYTGEVTSDIEDMIVEGVDENGQPVNYIKIYTTRTITMTADFRSMPQLGNAPGVGWYYLDEAADSVANSVATSYMINVIFNDCGGEDYTYDMVGRVCVMGVSENAASNATEGN